MNKLIKLAILINIFIIILSVGFYVSVVFLFYADSNYEIYNSTNLLFLYQQNQSIEGSSFILPNLGLISGVINIIIFSILKKNIESS